MSGKFAGQNVIRLDPRDLSTYPIGRYFFGGRDITFLASTPIILAVPQSEEELQKKLFKQHVLSVRIKQPFIQEDKLK